MRTILIAALAFAATPALAADTAPLTCQALQASEQAKVDAFDALSEAKRVAFSRDYEVELAIASADKRDAMFAARDTAKTQVSDLRRDARTAKKAHRSLAKQAETQSLVCTS
ncbi:MAG: hypothetical protein KC912_04800 [Proteobacteria bacterium]|nr:hypothetical protein [Pseudomonadota bacterium]